MSVEAEEARLSEELEAVRAAYRADPQDEGLKFQYHLAQRVLQDFRAQVRNSNTTVSPGSVNATAGSLYIPKE